MVCKQKIGKGINMTRSFIRDVLMELGLDPSTKGFCMVIDAELYISEHPDSMPAITKEIYPYVAKIHGSTVPRVERNIRYTKKQALNRDVHYRTAKMLKVENAMYHKGDITNGHFLAALMVYLQKREEMEKENASE